VRYAPELLRQLSENMMTELSAVERYSLVDDAWAAVTAGSLPARNFVALARRFETEPDLDVWAALIGGLASLERLLEGDASRAFRSLLQELFRPALERLGWEPNEGEGPRSLELRALLFRALAVTAADAGAVSRGRELHEVYLSDPSRVEPNLAAAAAAAVAAQGGAEEYMVFLGRFRKAATPQEERRYRSLLAAFPGSAEMARTLAMTLNGTVRTQDAPFLLAECLGNRDQGPLAWEFIRGHWDQMLREYPDNAIVRMLSGVRALSRPETAASVFRFFAEHQVPKGQRTMDQQLEKLRINVALRERESAPLAAAILAMGRPQDP
jgi:aminopeptidase N